MLLISDRIELKLSGFQPVRYAEDENLVLSAKKTASRKACSFCIIEDEVRTTRVRHRTALCSAKNYIWNVYALHLCAVLAAVWYSIGLISLQADV